MFLLAEDYCININIILLGHQTAVLLSLFDVFMRQAKFMVCCNGPDWNFDIREVIRTNRLSQKSHCCQYCLT